MSASSRHYVQTDGVRVDDPNLDPEAKNAWLLSGFCSAIGVLVILGVHWSSVKDTVSVWASSETFNHCFLIIPIFVYLVRRRWAAIRQLVPQPSMLAALPLGLGSLLWLIGHTAGALIGEQVALVLMIQSLILMVFGLQIFRALLFPILFLWFLVPIGTSLIPFFQQVTADMVVPLLRLTGIPVYIEDLFIHIPSGSFEVAEACSGVRYLISTLALGFLASNLFFENTARRVIFLALSLVIPILANGVRAYGIVMIAHLSDYQIAAGADHLIYGWVFFSVVTFCLLGIGVAMRGSEVDEESASAVLREPDAQHRPIATMMTLFAALGLASWGAVGQSYLSSSQSAPTVSTLRLDLQVALPWTETSAPARDVSLPAARFPGVTQEFLQSYEVSDGIVDLYVAYFADQDQGAEIVSEANMPFGDGSLWHTVVKGGWNVDMQGRTLSINRVELRSPESRQLVWYWYWVDRRFTANRFFAKLWEVQSKIFRGRGEGAYIAISTSLEDSGEASVTRLKSFLQHVGAIDVSLAQLAVRR